jgi:hypothetical protein
MSDNAENVIDFWRDKCKELTAEVERLRRILRQVGLHKEAEGD